MGIKDLQCYLGEHCKEALKPVDLVKIARGLALSQAGKKRGPNRLSVIVDAETCLDRLYGGFYSDWACGGQWNRMNDYLNKFIHACGSAHMEVLVFFNGAFESSRLNTWYQAQLQRKRHATLVMKHINSKGTPPPKVWWVPPSSLESSLRLALRQFGVPVITSQVNHMHEIMKVCRDNGFLGIIAEDIEFLVFNPPRYFSSQQLKLTYRGSLETMEYDIDDISKILDLHPKKFGVMAALLGNHILGSDDLGDFYFRICNVSEAEELKKLRTIDVVKAVVEFVRALSSVEDLDAVGTDVFGQEEEKIKRFKLSAQYYLNCTEEHFMKFRQELSELNRSQAAFPNDGWPEHANGVKAQPVVPAPVIPRAAPTGGNEDWDGNKLLKNTKPDAETGTPISSAYLEGESGYAASLESAKTESAKTPDIKVDPATSSSAEEEAVSPTETVEELQEKLKDLEVAEKEEVEEAVAEKPAEEEETAEKKTEEKSDETNSDEKNNDEKKSEGKKTEEKKSQEKEPGQPRRSHKKTFMDKPYKMSQEAFLIARERHEKGVMHPWILQIMEHGEICIDACMEDENNRDLPAVVELYRPVRQAVYAVLFDLTKRRLAYRIAIKEGKEPVPEKPKAVVREWVVPRSPVNSPVPKSEDVQAEELEWLVPGLHRLWLGQGMDDKNRRLRAFLSCMFSDSPLMLNTSFVPQHLIVVCAVLRFMIMYTDQRVLRKHELDAFLATAVSPMLHDVDAMQEMKLPMLTTRGVHLGTLFMQGVEHAIFVNDACGAPVPWGMCCPWMFFDGKLFHYKLLKATNNNQLLDICDGQVEQVMRVERMRQAILQGVPLDLVFARPPLANGPPHPAAYQGGPMHMRPAGALPGSIGQGPFGPNGSGRGGRGRGNGRGGQLQIAGVVVGQWGANTQAQQRPMGRGTHMSQGPQVTSVGPKRGGVPRVISSPAARGRWINRGSAVRGAINGRGGQNNGQWQQQQPPQRNQFNPGMPQNNSYMNTAGPRGGRTVMNGRGNGMRGATRGRHDMGGMDQRIKSPMEPRGRGVTVETHEGSLMLGNQLMKTPDMQYQGGHGHMPTSSHTGGMSPYGTNSGHHSLSVNNAMQQQANLNAGMMHSTQVSLNQSPLAAMQLANLSMSMGGMPHQQMQIGQSSLNGGQGDYNQFTHMSGAGPDLSAAGLGMMSQGDFSFQLQQQQRPDFGVMERMQLENMGMFDKHDD